MRTVNYLYSARIALEQLSPDEQEETKKGIQAILENNSSLMKYVEALPQEDTYALSYPLGIKIFYKIDEDEVTILEIVREARLDRLSHKGSVKANERV